MDNIDMNIGLMGELDFFINLVYTSSSSSGTWSFNGNASYPDARFKWFPARSGTYSMVGLPTLKMTILDPSSRPLLMLNGVLWPPSTDMTGDGVALFPAKSGVLLNWHT